MKQKNSGAYAHPRVYIKGFEYPLRISKSIEAIIFLIRMLTKRADRKMRRLRGVGSYSLTDEVVFQQVVNSLPSSKPLIVSKSS